MKKKIVSLLLAFVMLGTSILFTACGGEGGSDQVKEKNAYEIISEALDKTENLESMAAELKMEMSMGMEGMTMSVPIAIKLKAKDMKSENPVVSMLVSMSMLGQEINIEYYLEDQWAYMVMGEMKYKTNAEDMAQDFDYAQSATDMLQQIPEELLKDIQLVKAEDGSQSATIAFPGEKFAEIYDDFIESVNSDSETDIENIKITDPVVKITVADGYVTVYDMAFTMEITVEDATSSTEVKATLIYENPGQAVTITPPEGYQEFAEMDAEISW